ncbi:MAG: HAMP domain-containing histidine kinase [Acidimicrobiia bacterium]|nr:HAMP domain-containing histidine kinase [Acidimicrobiia bacterium]
MTNRAEMVVDRFHGLLLQFARWSIPSAFVIESITDIFDGNSGYQTRWYVFLALFLVVSWQLRRPKPNGIPILLAAVGFVSAVSLIEGVTGREVGGTDTATTMVVLVVLGIYLALIEQRLRPALVTAYIMLVLVVGVVTGIADGLDPPSTAIRAAVSTLLLWIGAWSFLRLKKGLESAIVEGERARTRSDAVAAFSEALLAARTTDEQAAAEALRRILDLDSVLIERSGSPVVIAGEPTSAAAVRKVEAAGARGVMGRIEVGGDKEAVRDIDSVLTTVAGMLIGSWERADALTQLEEHIRSKDRLVASVSHELRTPLTGILGFSETILELSPDLPGEIGEFMALIQDQSRDMSDIIEDLLAAARADIGTLSVQPESMDLAEQVHSVLATSRIQALGANKTLGVEVAAMQVVADPLRCRQVIRNLLTNALRYGGENVLLVTGGDESKVWVDVSDDGPGLSGTERSRLFEPYFRARQTPTQPGSVGLGLAVSRQLARLMGGEVELLETLRGTTFRFSLARPAPLRLSATG